MEFHFTFVVVNGTIRARLTNLPMNMVMLEHFSEVMEIGKLAFECHSSVQLRLCRHQETSTEQNQEPDRLTAARNHIG